MNISKTLKSLVALNKFTEECNAVVYGANPVLDIGLTVYGKIVALEAMKQGTTLEKVISTGIFATSHKKLPLVNTSLMLVNRALLIKRIGLKQAIIKDLTITVIATGIGYAYTKALDELEGN